MIARWPWKTSTFVHGIRYSSRSSRSSSNSSRSSDRCNSGSGNGFSHLNDAQTLPQMVNVGTKAVTQRIAIAQSRVVFPPSVYDQLVKVSVNNQANHNRTNEQDEEQKEPELVSKKGPILTTAMIAGVLGAKQTSQLIPFCHPLLLEDVQVRITRDPQQFALVIECQVQVTSKTGVEMEALTGASVAALCVYDMCKALSHGIVIQETKLIYKTGGKHHFDCRKHKPE